MAARSSGDPRIDALYAGRAGRVDVVDVPPLLIASLDGVGRPETGEFEQAIGALYAVSYGAHFAVRKQLGEAPRVMPLEGLWWVEGADAQRAVERFAEGLGPLEEADPTTWRWRLLIVQMPPIDEAALRDAAAAAASKVAPDVLARLDVTTWEEGRCVQTLHVGPYADEGPTLVRLHEAIAERGLRARGRHHEIYLGDPRRSAPERLRTLLRQPVEPTDADVITAERIQPGM